MGQQQLLLVILVTIIVGIATVVAINTFGSAADSANVDAVRVDLAQIAASAQGYYMKPQMLGGGSRSFTGLDFNTMAFSGTIESATSARNENALYTLPATTDANLQEFIVTAAPASGGEIAARVCPDGMRMGIYNPDGTAAAPPACTVETTTTTTTS
jgi:Tfp pilus assembly protein PilE